MDGVYLEFIWVGQGAVDDDSKSCANCLFAISEKELRMYMIDGVYLAVLSFRHLD